MKFAIVILVVVAAVSAQQDGKYNPYNPYNRYNPFNRNYNPFNPYARPPPPYYNPQDYYRSTYRPFFSSTPSPFVSSTFAPPTYAPPTYAPSTIAPPVVPVVPKVYPKDGSASAQILRFDNEIGPDGSYSYAYETSNGIAAQEQGTPRDFGGNPPNRPDVAQGAFAWTSPEGVPVAISYIADENGYQPQGDAIPTPPPVPPQIARALDFIARNEPATKN